MGTFAYISIITVVLKLVIAYIIQIVQYDRLVIYALFLLGTTVLERILYQVYCYRHFPEARRIRIKRYPQFREMLSFAGWKLFGNMMVVANTQGVNILLNMFFGPVINAARGIAYQVEGAINSFIVNFQLAVRPQITKSYAVRDINRVQELIVLSSKLSFFLLLLFALPFFIEAEKVLALWLKDVPEHTASFLRLILLVLFISPLENPVTIAKDSTGSIKKYSVVSSCLQSTIIIFDYLALKLGCAPEIVFVIQFVVLVITLLAKFIMVRKEICISIKQYFSQILLILLVVTAVACIIPVSLHMMMDDSITSFLVICIVSILSVLFSSFFIGLNHKEREAIIRQVNKAFRRK